MLRDNVVSRATVDDLRTAIAIFEAERMTPPAVPYRERIEALGALSQALVERRSPALSQVPGIAFLAAFLSPTVLGDMMRRELGDLESLDGFVSIGGRKRLRLVPRGIVCHWIAGNVPLLGALSWALSAAVGNFNIVRLSTRQEDLLSPLLELLAAGSPAGEWLARRTAVVQFAREDLGAHAAMSQAADVRIAWGGREAVDSIRGLEAGWDADTIVLGPRVSLAVIDPSLMDPRRITRLASDIAYFDQQACSSPQRLFVKGVPGEAAFDAFMASFGAAFAAQARAIPRHALDCSETYAIELDRARVLLYGGAVVRDDATAWTIAIVDRPNSDVRCANRFVQVVPYTDVSQIFPFIPRNAQTAVTLLRGAELESFTERAALAGICRFPQPGEANNFETPWDGIPLVSRLARWVVRTDAAV